MPPPHPQPPGPLLVTRDGLSVPLVCTVCRVQQAAQLRKSVCCAAARGANLVARLALQVLLVVVVPNLVPDLGSVPVLKVTLARLVLVLRLVSPHLASRLHCVLALGATVDASRAQDERVRGHVAYLATSAHGCSAPAILLQVPRPCLHLRQHLVRLCWPRALHSFFPSLQSPDETRTLLLSAREW